MRFKFGLTLVEILVGIAVFGLITVLIAAIYLSHYKIYSNQNSQIDAASQSKVGIDEIVNQIRQSASVANSCTPCGSDTTSSSVLILQLWPLDSNGDPKDPSSGNYDYIVYKKNPIDITQMIRKILPNASSTRKGGNQIISSNISSLTFTYNNADPTQATKVTIVLTTSQAALGKTQTSTQTKVVDLRNK